MEVKLSLRERPLDLCVPLFKLRHNFPSNSLKYPKSWENSEWVFRKRFGGTVKKWRLRLLKISMHQCSAKHCLVHVVKEGETLTSISKQYGVSIYAIAAANENVADIDLVYQGQRLTIPSVPKGILAGERNWLAKFKLPEKILGSLNISNEVLQPKNFCLLRSHLAPHVYQLNYRARTIGCILVLVPLIAFCIKCIAGAIHTRAVREVRERGLNVSDVKHHSSGGARWKSALGDAWGPEFIDAQSVDSSEVKENHSEDDAQTSYEEESRAYRKLEHDYQKFLAQCGMSKFGYWRGGSSR